MKHNLLILSIVIVLGGCGQEQGQEQAQVNAAPSTICGVTSHKSDGSFSYNCGLSVNDKIVTNETLKNVVKGKQVCEVDFRDNGQLNYLHCSEMAEPISSYISKGAKLEAVWQCTGLDGFGGYDNEKLSELTLNENGTYQIHISGKEKSDSVWFVTDSIISGHFQINDLNGLLLTPKEWRNDVIDAAGLSLDSAPKFMLVTPVKIKIKNLTRTELYGEAEFSRGGNITEITDIQCNQPLSEQPK